MTKFKKRDFSVKNRLVVEADYLNEYGFTSGTNIKYRINNRKKKIVISIVKNEGNSKVYRTTQHRKKVVPVIDIRNKDVISFIKDNKGELELFICQGKIILRKKEKVALKGFGKVLNLIQKKKKNQLVVSAKRFAEAIGCEQLDLFEMFTMNENLDSENTSKIITKMKNRAIKMISLFSGAGMLDKGFLDEGYDIEFAIDRSTPVEYDSNGKKKRPMNDLGSYHIETYRHNIGDHIVDKDILSLTKEDIKKVDLVVGGIPCTSFSKLNTSINSYRKSEESDFPLLDKFIEVVRWSEAKAFLIENVPDFITIKQAKSPFL